MLGARLKLALFRAWHASCKPLERRRRMVRPAPRLGGSTMFRFENFAKTAASVAAALALTAMFVSAAVPVMPVA